MAIEEYLSKLGENVVESHGKFELDVVGQARKLALYQNETPSLYLLKGIQAAVACKSADVSIRVGRTAVELEFSPVHLEFNVERLFVQDHPDHAAGHLKQMLMAAMAAQPQECCLTVCGNGFRQVWHWKRGEQPAHESKPWSNEPTRVSFRVVPPHQSWWKALMPSPFLAQLRKEVPRRCMFSPIPVFLDSRVVNNPYPEKLVDCAEPVPFGEERAREASWRAEHLWLRTQGELESLSLAYPLARGAGNVRVQSRLFKGIRTGGHMEIQEESALTWIDGDLVDEVNGGEMSLEAKAYSATSPEPDFGGRGYLGFGFDLEKSGSDRNRFVYCSRLRYLGGIRGVHLRDIATVTSALKWSLPAVRLGRWLGVMKNPRGLSQIFYVQDGVLLNPVTVTSAAVGTTALIAVSELKTDLSFLNVVVDEVVEADTAWILREEGILIAAASSAGAAAWRRDFSGGREVSVKIE